MRTDPRAAEVRAIVKRVFASFLRENESFAGPAVESRLWIGRLAVAFHKTLRFRRPRNQADVPRRSRPYQKAAASRRTPKAGGLWLPSPASINRNAIRTARIDGRRRNSRKNVPFAERKTTMRKSTKKSSSIEGDMSLAAYCVAGIMAMWLVAVGIVQFYDDGGRMLGTINLFESLRPKRMTA